jgi:hypothetical protein
MNIKELVEQAGWSGLYSVWLNPNEVILLPVPVTELELERFAELVRQDEREACAKLCESLEIDGRWFANKIRAKGNHEQD